MIYLQMLLFSLTIPKGIPMLDLYKLHAFVVVVEERNITHAANRLFIQQPPLTRLLKNLNKNSVHSYLFVNRAGLNRQKQV